MNEYMSDYTTGQAGSDIKNVSEGCGEAKKGMGTSLRLHGGGTTDIGSLACKEGGGEGVPGGRYRSSTDLESGQDNKSRPARWAEAR